MCKRAERPRSENGAFSADLVVDMQERVWSSRFINYCPYMSSKAAAAAVMNTRVKFMQMTKSFASNCKFISVESLCLLKLAVLKQGADLTEGWF